MEGKALIHVRLKIHFKSFPSVITHILHSVLALEFASP